MYLYLKTKACLPTFFNGFFKEYGENHYVELKNKKGRTFTYKVYRTVKFRFP